MTKEIKLTQGQVAIVDDWWFDELNTNKWFAAWDPKTHSYRAARKSKSQTPIYMHAVVAGTPKGMMTDHINGDTLDNQNKNLRVCTNSQNMMNRSKQTNNTSGFKGVFKDVCGWHARITVNKKNYNLKTWDTEIEAARAYDEAAKQLHGEFAVLNFPD